uniref:Uncharacterized protein n=1 Tax=Tanacetum cinerariifolium TaxID=118510 RepID=A0A6L2N7F9_TANCI|nr:hypothetical protein [Tanacetum cinerariifolium]
MDQQNPTLAKIPILDTGKLEQWQFRIQQYLQHEHYALWEVIEFGDSYKVPATAASPATTGTSSDETGKKKGRIVTVTAGDMQKRKNDVKERTTLLLYLPDEHQLQFKIEQDDLNRKFLTSLAPEWLMHTIVRRNRSDLDTMSLDDLYNHLKVYESEVQKKSKTNSQNMAFISSAKHSKGNEEVNTASVSTASTNVPTASANIRVVTISQDTTCAYIASQSSGSQIKFEDINQIDEDDIEEMDIKWNMAFLSMRADRAPRSQDRRRRDNYRQGSKVKEQAPKALMAIDGVGWDWSYMANDEENHTLVVDKEAPIEFALMANTSAESMVFDNSLCSKDCKKNTDSLNSKITDLTNKRFDAKNMIYHYKLGLVQVESRLAEHRDREIKYCEKIRGLKYKTESSDDYIEILKKELELIKKEKEGLDSKLTGFQTPSKGLDSLLESQRLDKNKEGLGYSVVPPPPAQIYSPSKKDMSWTGLPEFKDDTVTDYSRPVPTVESSPDDAQNRNPSVIKTEASPSTISPKSFIKFVKANDSPTNSKTDKAGTAKKPSVKKFPTANRKISTGGIKFSTTDMGKKEKAAKPQLGSSWKNINDKVYWDSGCSRHMTGNISYLFDYEPFDEGYVPFGQGGCKITGKRTIKSEFIVLGQNFKLSDDDNMLLRTPRQHNMYSINLNNIVPHKDLTCLVAKASTDECMLWRRRLSHLNFKTMNKLVRRNLVRGLPTKCFENDHTCTACQKGKQYKVSCKSKLVNSVSKPLHTLHMDLFGLTSVSSISHKWYCLVVTDDFSRVFNKRTMRVEENLHVEFLENKAIKKGAGPNWLFDIESLTKSMNYVPVDAGTNSTNPAGTKDATSQEVKKDISSLRYISLSNWVYDALLESSSSKPQDDCSSDVPERSGNFNPNATSTNPSTDQLETLTVETPIPTVSSLVLTACFTDSQEPSSDTRLISKRVDNQVETPSLDNILTLTNRFEDILGVTNLVDSDGVEADSCGYSNSNQEQVQREPKKISDALQDPSWVEAMGKTHWTKWVLKNKKDERGIVIRNKARLVAQGYTQEEGIDYNEVFTPVARIEAIRLFLAYASFMGFTVYQIDDPEFPAKVYKVEKAMYGLHQAPRAWHVYVDDIIFGSSNPQLCKEFEALMHENFQMSAMGELNFFLGLQVLQKEDGIFLSQDKYIGDILKKFGYSDVRSSNTPMDKENPWGKDGTGKDVDLHLNRSMIGSLMYLTASRPDIMIANQLLEGVSFLGRRLISWQCKKQTIVATSTTEAEYVAAAKIRHHFIRDCFEKKLTSVDHIHTDENVADLLTKPFDAGRFQYLVTNICSLSMPCEALSKEISSSILRLLRTAKTFDLEWIWLGGDYGNFFNGFLWDSVVNMCINFLHGSDSEQRTHEFIHVYLASASVYVWIGNKIMARLQFCEYHNMVAILEKNEHNVDFHPIVDFVEASPLRYALTIKPIVYVSHIGQFWSTARIEIMEEGIKILAIVDGILRTVTESSLRRNLKLQDEEGISSLPDAELFENLTLMGYNISPNQKFTFQKDEPASPLRDVSQGEACLTDSGFGADQERENIAKTSTLPHDSAPRVTSPDADEGSMQQTLNELMALCTSLQRQHSEMISKFEAQELEINMLKARVKLLEDREGGGVERSRDDAPIKGRNLDEEEAAAERVSDNTEELATVLTSMDAATVLASGVAEVPTSSGSIPTAGPSAAEVPTGSDVVLTAGLIFVTATVIDAQVARELEKKMTREDQRMSEQVARDAEIARIHAEEELHIMIDGLDRSNETVAKYLQEYHQFALELPLERRIELISDLVRYQDNYAKIHKYQSQQRNPWSKKKKRDYYMAVIKSNLGWKVKDFRGMTFEEIEAKFTAVWKQIKDFIPISSKEEAERFKRKGIRFEQESVKRLKTSEEVSEDVKSPDEVPKEKSSYKRPEKLLEDHKARRQLRQLPIFYGLIKAFGQRGFEPVMGLSEGVSQHQNLMHALVEWKLYKSCRVHHVTSKDNEIFMLIEKDYSLRKGLAIVMICYKLQVENYS